MIKHVCLITFKDDTDADTRRAVKEAYEKLPSLIPEIKSFEVGLDAGLLEGNASLAIVGEFASADDFKVYSEHPAQMEVIYPVCGPVMAGYATAQYDQ